MGYYVRVLSTSAHCVEVAVLEAALKNGKFRAKISLEQGQAEDWTQLLLSHSDGSEIAVIERNPVREGLLGAEELQEFHQEVGTCLPASAAEWLQSFFPSVRCIYAFQLLSGTEHKQGWEILGEVKNAIWSCAPSILQADNEGFTNEAGYHILWQFSDSVNGPWWMGILQDGLWKHFQMELGNPEHRDAFRQGCIPPGILPME